MADQTHWNKVAQEEINKGQQMQDVSMMASQEKDQYLAARKQYEQQQQNKR